MKTGLGLLSALGRRKAVGQVWGLLAGRTSKQNPLYFLPLSPHLRLVVDRVASARATRMGMSIPIPLLK
jgi:hypothetical protein